MIQVEGYRAFRGDMTIRTAVTKPFTMHGDWLFKPDTGCWYGCGSSFPERICEPRETEKTEG